MKIRWVIGLAVIALTLVAIEFVLTSRKSADSDYDKCIKNGGTNIFSIPPTCTDSTGSYRQPTE